MGELDVWFPRGEPSTEVVGRVETPTQEHKPTQIKKRGENWTRDYLKKIFNIYTEKRSDAPFSLPDGSVTTPKKRLDYFGSVPLLGGWSGHLEMEVKTFSGISFPLSNIKPHQAALLSEAANRGDVSMLSLVRVLDEQVDTMWWIPWARGYPNEPKINIKVGEGYGNEAYVHTFAWLMTKLRERAKGTRFQAKSIREQDFDLLEEWAVRKEGRIWKAASGHWLAKLTGQFERVAQPSLL